MGRCVISTTLYEANMENEKEKESLLLELENRDLKQYIAVLEDNVIKYEKEFIEIHKVLCRNCLTKVKNLRPFKKIEFRNNIKKIWQQEIEDFKLRE